MSLRDLKPGDRVQMEFTVATSAPGWEDLVRLSAGDSCWDFSERELAWANALKLPPRARPVRKGDTVKPNSSPVTTTFLTTWENQVVIWRNGYGSDVYGKEYVTHADGTPIDWEASE